MEALAVSPKPLTPYRVAKEYDMNVAKVYIEMKRLTRLGVVRAAGRRRGVEYRLADEDLRGLALKYSSRVVPLEEWNSPQQRASRLRMGLRRIPPYAIELAKDIATKPTRLPGELDGLASLGRKRFDARYRRVAEREFARV